ncbi:chaplin family protein [Streptomyces cyanogenus]|uniref:Chaplin-B n=1 Tax=Streptomyces cyanogenus TaxID=80860 RepID=A0ABX7TIJ0_STRCY|nr:chaplin family protein [Streptomyces cyanogenus]QTD96385.1 Chaplin-B [Streptomyces cyanogenus]
MRRATRNGVIAVAAASGAMAVALPVSAAFAAGGAEADGSAAGSPGLVSGNGIQLPVHVPANVCGNTVNVVGLLNPVAGNACANTGGGESGGAGTEGTPAASGGASAYGDTADSPGVLSGNGIQLPVHAPVNVTGNSVDVVGIGNPAHGNQSVNGPVEAPRPAPHTPSPEPRAPKPPAPHHTTPHAPRAATSTLAHTGADLTAPAVAGSAALLLTGAILYRRFRPGRPC